MRFRGEVFGTAASNTAIAGVAMIAGLLVARALGPSDRGSLATAMAFFGVALALGEVGTTTAITYYSAREPTRASQVAREVRRLYVYMSAAASAGLVVAALVMSRWHPQLLWPLLGMACIVPITFQVAIPNSALLGIDIVRWNKSRVIQPSTYLTCILVLIVSDRVTLVAVIGAFAVSNLAFWLAAEVMLRRAVREAVASGSTGAGTTDVVDYRSEVLKYGIRNFPATIPSAFMGRMDIIILSALALPAVVGTYAVATTLAGLAQPVAGAIPQLVLPRMASTNPEDFKVRTRLARRSVIASGLVATLVAVFVAATAPLVVRYVLGSEYASTSVLTAILCLGTPASAMALSARNSLRGLGRPARTIGPEWIGALVGIAALLVLVPIWGAVGAAVAGVITAWGLLITYLIALRLTVGQGRATDHGGSEPGSDS